MKHVLLAALLILAAGCARPQPTLAHGKPASYWVEALQHADARERRKAAEVLGNVGAVDPAVVPALAGAVRDRDLAVRGAAVLALLKMGPAAQDAAPALREAAKDRDPHVRANAVKALEKIQDQR
jgi:HEAT repeat protein